MRRGFTLVEMLLAVFVIAIGTISVFALFGVGLTQQRQSQDDMIGPTIAQNAIETLRLKLSPDMFGYRNLSGFPSDPVATLPGDFSWSVPAHKFQDDPSTPDRDEAGIADIFGTIVVGCDTSSFIPVSPYKPTSGAVVTQDERMTPDGRYGWDFAIRRHDGRIQVAVFVYRVVNDTWAEYWTVRSSPAVRVLSGIETWPAFTSQVPFTRPTRQPDLDGPVILGDPWESWHEPGSILLDEHGNTYRVSQGRRTRNDGPMLIQGGTGDQQTTRLWYVSSIDDSRGFSIKVIHVAVFDL